MIFSRLFSVLLRILQIAAAVVVMGITSDYVHDVNKVHGKPSDQLVYTLVIAVFSIVVAFVLLIPFTATLTLFPLDFLFFILWIVSFGILVNWIAPMSCTNPWWSDIWPWNNNDPSGGCQRWKAVLALTFLSAMFWLLSSLVALWVVHRGRGAGRRWYRSHNYP